MPEDSPPPVQPLAAAPSAAWSGGFLRRRAISPARKLAWLIVGVTLVRLVAAASIHLTEDEAYYRLWSAHLHAGYYDHPPMIAWWIRAGTSVAGDGALGVRLFAVLGCAATTWLVYDLARVFGAGEATGWRAALWYNCTLTVGWGGLLATPDAPASLFWAATVWALARAVRASAARAVVAGWLGAGVLAGLAVLSKYSALFLGPGVLLWLLATPPGRLRLRGAGPWLAVMVAAAVASPNLVWNASHGWITIAKQFGRLQPEGLRLQHLPEFLVVQVLLLTPVIALYGLFGIADVARGRSRLGEGGAMTAFVGAPFCAYLVFHSLHASVQAHWPVPLYGGAALLAAAAAADRAWGRRWALMGPVVSMAALVHLAAPRTDFGRLDPALPLRGWPRFAAMAQARARLVGARWIGTESYGAAAQLVSEHGALPVLQIDERRRYDGLDVPDASVLRRPGLVLDLARRVVPADLSRCFGEVRELEALERGANAGPVERYRAFSVDRPRVALAAEGCLTAKARRGR